ncbi:hypothetical protein [Curtobacterium sp. VKM Ac-2852]|uniref:hypothetical protein n=1 Tax=Curtobacterium sp. VKM Ac-2852 TaxID=2739024 RepID=UPI001566000B|nr:hypothetical protein [Curtobacterium sp. VKM Ac-2852]NQX23318.1 hypothetical protein [Curtobacterium sp. VKM Ac-2852]
MTDARFPERYLSDRKVLRLSADEFRGWAFATIWSVSNRTDGVILSDELLLVPFMKVETAKKLEACGLWVANGDGWSIADFPDTQTSRHDLEVLDNMRRAQREKKQRQRAAKAVGSTDSPSFSDVPGDSTGGPYPGTSRGRVPEDRTGQERTGRDQEKWFVNDEIGEITDPAPSVPAPLVTTWDVAPIGRSCTVCGTSMVGYPDSMKVCASQDDEHTKFRTQNGWAA